jgi:hypothetical protein
MNGLTMKAHSVIAVVLLGACQANTTDNFLNPPNGPPSTCNVDSAVEGCLGGSVGYTCMGDRPDDGDVSLVCSDGVAAAAGLTAYCCAPFGTYWNDCNVDTSIAGCVDNSYGFSCTGEESPSEADASLVCSAGTPSGSDTLYCCNSAVLKPTCAPDAVIQPSCQGVAIGYSCTQGDTPTSSDSDLACAPSSITESGVVGYCCIPFTAAPSTCQLEASLEGCAASDYAFSCSDGATPEALDPGLSCKPTASGGFCCTPLPD